MEIIISLISIAILVVVVSFSYAYIKLEKQEKDVNVLGTDCIKLEMEEETDALYLTKAYPMTDENGAKTDPFTFKLRNDCGIGVNYEIHLRVEETEEEQIAAKNIATSVDGEEKVKLTNKVSTEGQPEEYKINNKELTLNPYETVEHNVRIWLDESAGNDTQNKTFKSRIVIEATQNQIVEKYYKEAILHGADPVLNNTEGETNLIQTASGEETTNNDTLVPVIIGDDGTVTKADVTQEWYDYETKKWANAVILVDNSQADTIQPGEEIQEDQIESYFVWIPKYKYKLFNLEKYDSLLPLETEYVEKSQPIEIQFDLEDTKDEIDGECKTPNASGDNGECKEGDWMTHPAFTAFKGSKGFWVGKFETGYKDANENTFTEIKDGKATCKNDVNIENTSNIIIKPNSYSWICTNVANAYKNGFNYERKLDSHMMKNTEWGAVAFLSHSKYGTCIGSSCTEVRINNSTNFVTGYAAIQKPTTGYDEYKDYGDVIPGKDAEANSNFKGTYNYKNPSSKVASTTGNYTGIYDMSGGAWEYVMVYMKDNVGNSGLTEQDLTETNAKYYDVYKNENGYKKRILGDATGEMGPFIEKTYGNTKNIINMWHENYALMSGTEMPWFTRGGAFDAGITTGVFAMMSDTGDNMNGRSFRIVLTPTNEAM